MLDNIYSRFYFTFHFPFDEKLKIKILYCTLSSQAKVHFLTYFVYIFLLRYPIFHNLFKKVDKSDNTNYPPISNLCFVSKIFKKFILNRILDILETNIVDLIGGG